MVHIPDVLADSGIHFTLEGQRLGGYRTVLTVPMLREGVPNPAPKFDALRSASVH